ncbi:iron-containing alcohol dehydrogenase PsrA [Burkholderia plantarii]|uniref:iron-containing alcohol dehydrogenase PsrA n=1 Tax=Burkholderia plantarii TaxID=41899 RepID=UPI0008707C30|nr:iron-containing alcohol dehydrogenase PsrA [Burkholderia plantarii]
MSTAAGWQFHNPVRVRFGIDTLDAVGEVLAGRRYALVTYPDPAFAALAARIEASAGPALARIDSVEANPSVTMLARACQTLAALPAMPEVLVALGGGSVMDSAKVLAAEHGRLEPVLAWIADGTTRVAERALPIVAIPTTSGTGSEVTSWATVWDPARDRKLSLARDDLYPETVLVDPRLVVGLPPAPTLASGLDALSHALESLWNVHANPVTRGLAVSAAREILDALPRVMAAPDDLAARAAMALGALRAGLAFSNTRTALAHNLSYAITLRHGVAHGIACSFCLPAVMRAALGADPDCDRALAEVFGSAEAGPARLEAFLGRLGIACEPAAYGIGAREWHDIVAGAFDGARGRNFIGARARFPQFDFAEAAHAAPPA